ncbi:hypothetical protein GCM10022198_22890 [Klugiella xanthotipulae]|uniref:Uncharacterized protein n=1 Tax=Klugiella xanthotipulae TaxID=244735 RepID=A0A543HY98_9MICO|nr:hypothetical protein [Klugiella xanthotipulae]TQM63311.1 hypothetical protein FB466_1571 [Klugiella xanthotipulae]
MTRRGTRSGFVAVLAIALLAVTLGVRESVRTEAAWLDVETGRGTVGTLTLAAPVSQEQCAYDSGRPSDIQMVWKYATGTPAAAGREYGYVSSGKVVAVPSNLTGSVTTTGSRSSGYRSTFDSDLFSETLGGKYVVAVRTTLVISGGSTWTSPWLTATVTPGTEACVMSDR